MSWDQVLMAFVDKMLESEVVDLDSFFITNKDVVDFTGLSSQSVSNNLSVCVKRGWLRKEDSFTGGGRETRYYINNSELVSFVDKYLRGDR